ncbi:MAG: ATP-binding protein [Lachnospiraceae bacterium]|nr:ATP-binding protein [Lachnospiraceae bacterium]
MSKVLIMCGKICSGKSTYAEKLKLENKAVILSVDELTLALFENQAGEKLDFYVEKLKEYFLKKSLDIVEAGADVILDWGFWTKKERDYAREFYDSRNISYQFYYMNVGIDEWKNRILKRNQEIKREQLEAYPIDKGLLSKVEKMFEEPDRKELKAMIIIE